MTNAAFDSRTPYLQIVQTNTRSQDVVSLSGGSSINLTVSTGYPAVFLSYYITPTGKLFTSQPVLGYARNAMKNAFFDGYNVEPNMSYSSTTNVTTYSLLPVDNVSHSSPNTVTMYIASGSRDAT